MNGNPPLPSLGPHVRRGALLERIGESLPGATPPMGWEFLLGQPHVRVTTTQPTAILASLEQEFTTADLQAARVLVADAQGPQQLAPILEWPGATVLVLREAHDKRPFDLVTQRGSLVATDPPSFHACRDAWTRSASGEARMIFVACSESDLAVLSLLGLPATPSAGLDRLTGMHIRRLFNIFPEAGKPTPSHPLASVTSEKYELVIMGWSLTRLNSDWPATAEAIVARIVHAIDAFGRQAFEACPLKIWRPSRAELQAIRAAAALADIPAVRKRLWESARYSTMGLTHFVQTRAAASCTYADARRQLQTLRGQQTTAGRAQLREAVERLDRCFARDVVDKITAEALAAQDGVKQSLLLGAAGPVNEWHALDTDRVQVEQAANGFSQACDDPDKRLNQQLKIVDQLRKVKQALQPRSGRKRRRG